MGTGIYFIQDAGKLVEMKEERYDKEDHLQELLANYPNLLAGDQINSVAPRRWLLVKREFGLPSEEDGGDRWSLDHLFLDQDAIPTIVEAKRSSDPRLRREVVGQMLDYAANAVAYLPVETIRARFEETCQGHDPGQVIREAFGSEIDPEDFWLKVKTNLQAGKIRMIFVADEIPTELRRVVEFLNTQMDPAEVLAVEVKQYVSEGQQALVPRVLGQTEEAQRKKSSGLRATKRWNETSFFAALEAKGGPEECQVVRKIIDWANEQGLSTGWKDYKGLGELYVCYHTPGKWTHITCLFTDGSLSMQFYSLKRRRPFTENPKLSELRVRLNKIPGIAIALDDASDYGDLPLTVLTNGQALAGFLETLNWLVQEIRSCDSARSTK